MKRSGLYRLKPADVSLKMQQCLKVEGVNANGVVCPWKRCTEVMGNEFKESDSNETNQQEKGDDNRREKGNILSTIRRKWRKSKRNKRCDSRNADCQVRSENTDPQCACVRHSRVKKQKGGCKITIWPAPLSVLRSHKQVPTNDKVCHDGVYNSEAKTTEASCSLEPDCSCLQSPSRKSSACANSCAPWTSKLLGRSSRSLSDVTSGPPNPSESSLTSDNSCRIYSSVDAVDQCGTNDETVTASLDSTSEVVAVYDPHITQRFGNLTHELYKLSKYGWYWGPINRGEAEEKLVDQPDGAFLVRDSSDDRYILSLSFRSQCKTLHTRIEHSNGLFSFYLQPEPEGHTSIVELVTQSMCYSKSGVFCYSRSRSPGSPSYPVRLTKPISRFTQVRSLQYLCRFVIRQYTRYDLIQNLPLPSRLKGYLEEGHY